MSNVNQRSHTIHYSFSNKLNMDGLEYLPSALIEQQTQLCCFSRWPGYINLLRHFNKLGTLGRICNPAPQ